jgi:hypothetical protein
MDHPIDRRAWLRLAAAGLAWPAISSAADDASDIESKARSVGLGKLGRSESEHYLAIGNAPEGFRDVVVAACESMAAEFVKHFREKGFKPLDLPPGRMTVVVLADAASYAKFAGGGEGLSVGGHYEPGTNRLVIFDYRASRGELAANAERINSFTLSHETNHQLDFNTGLLDRAGDVPLCISEGLASYGETWRLKPAVPIGRVNRPRLAGLSDKTPWIRLEQLLTEDNLLDDETRRDAAYAQSWLLIHSHMKDPPRLPRLRAYLAAIKPRRDPSHRLDDAREHLGDLDALDKYLRRYTRAPKGQ